MAEKEKDDNLGSEGAFPIKHSALQSAMLGCTTVWAQQCLPYSPRLGKKTQTCENMYCGLCVHRLIHLVVLFERLWTFRRWAIAEDGCHRGLAFMFYRLTTSVFFHSCSIKMWTSGLTLQLLCFSQSWWVIFQNMGLKLHCHKFMCKWHTQKHTCQRNNQIHSSLIQDGKGISMAVQ